MLWAGRGRGRGPRGAGKGGLGRRRTDGRPRSRRKPGRGRAPAGRSCSRRLESKFAAPGPRASGRPRRAPEPPPREGAPSSGWGPSVLQGGGLQPGAERAERAKSPGSAGGPTPRAPRGSLSVSLGVFSQSCRKAEWGPSGFKAPERKRRGRHPLTAVRCTVSCSRSPAGAAASVAPPGAGNILMALALGREPGMTLGIRQQGRKGPLAGSHHAAV